MVQPQGKERRALTLRAGNEVKDDVDREPLPACQLLSEDVLQLARVERLLCAKLQRERARARPDVDREHGLAEVLRELDRLVPETADAVDEDASLVLGPELRWGGSKGGKRLV